MKTLKITIVVALGVLGFVLACNDGYQPSLDFWGIVCLIGAISLGLYWNRFGQLEDDDEFI